MSKYHEILGIPENATAKEIKAAYRRLAKKYHPDLNPDDPRAEEIFIRITEAHNMLLNPQKQRKTQSYRHQTVTEEDLRNAARERAKAYAQMRYAEFYRQNMAYEATPMHKILWPKWVNYLFIAVSLIFVFDTILPRHEFNCVLSTKNEFRYHACNHSFIRAPLHAASEIDKKEAIIECTPIMGFVTQYKITDDSFWGMSGYLKPERREVDFVFMPIVIFILSIVVLANNVKKFENKLLTKAVMIIATISYGISIMPAFF